MAGGLVVSDLAVHFPTERGVVRAVDGISFDVERGTRLGFVGESGSGKTTTALAIMRMIKAPGRIVAGSIRLDDADLVQMSDAEVRAIRLRRIAYIPQGAMNSLNPVLPIGRQIADGVIDHLGPQRDADLKALVAESLDRVGLAPTVAAMFPHELSGGMKQRVCIAIGIVLKPDVIVADEPTSALDVITQRRVMDTLGRVQEAIGASLILIGHDMGLMAQFVDELVVMKDGRIVERGAIRGVFQAPEHAYTKMLISSVPDITEGRSFLGTIPTPAEPKPATGAAPSPLVAFRNVSKVYGRDFFGRGGVHALRPLSFELDAGRSAIVSVVGQSGSGKTTLANILLGITRPTTGDVRFEGKSVAGLRGTAALAFRRGVQAIFQDPYGAFNPFYKVDHTLALPLRRFGIATSRRDIYVCMEHACDAVGLDPHLILGRYTHELSGGQRQRLQVARALMLNPKLIVADEPVSMVDASLRATILKSLYDLKARHGISIAYITHDLATAYHVSDYVIVLHHGHVAEAGTPRDVIGNPQHPYTQLLIDSIPWPDPDRHWGSRQSVEDDQRRLEEIAASHQTIVRSRIPGFDLDTAA